MVLHLRHCVALHLRCDVIAVAVEVFHTLIAVRHLKYFGRFQRSIVFTFEVLNGKILLLNLC